MTNVYAIIHPEGYAKIGKAKAPYKRFEDIRPYSPYTLELFAVLSTDGDALDLEARIHTQLEAKRVSGEWFEMDKTGVMEVFKEVADKDDEVFSLRKVEFERHGEKDRDFPNQTGFSKAGEL